MAVSNRGQQSFAQAAELERAIHCRSDRPQLRLSHGGRGVKSIFSRTGSLLAQGITFGDQTMAR
jgi:hypothetical protein